MFVMVASFVIQHVALLWYWRVWKRRADGMPYVPPCVLFRGLWRCVAYCCRGGVSVRSEVATRRRVKRTVRPPSFNGHTPVSGNGHSNGRSNGGANGSELPRKSVDMINPVYGPGTPTIDGPLRAANVANW